MDTTNLATPDRQEFITTDEAEFWRHASGNGPVTFVVGGDEMKPVTVQISEPGITVQRVAGDQKRVSYKLVASSPEEMAYKVIWLFNWMEKKGYVHRAWIRKGTKIRAGYGSKPTSSASDSDVSASLRKAPSSVHRR